MRLVSGTGGEPRKERTEEEVTSSCGERTEAEEAESCQPPEVDQEPGCLSAAEP